jgi:hypothetical protein
VFLPALYAKTFCDLPPPLSIVNEFIYINIISPILEGEHNPTAFTLLKKRNLAKYLERKIPVDII